jgi:hypothetical protein
VSSWFSDAAAVLFPGSSFQFCIRVPQQSLPALSGFLIPPGHII